MPVGVAYTMGVRQATYAAALIHPKVFLPMYFDTFRSQRLESARLLGEVRTRSPHVPVGR
jgi:hypothetical protein